MSTTAVEPKLLEKNDAPRLRKSLVVLTVTNVAIYLVLFALSFKDLNFDSYFQVNNVFFINITVMVQMY